MLNALNPPQQKVTNFLYLPNVICGCSCVSSVLGSFGLAFVSCSYGRFVPLGGTCRPGYLVTGECTEGCRARSHSRGVSCGAPYPANDEVELASCGVCPAGSLLFMALFGLPGSSVHCLACCLGCLAIEQGIAYKGFYTLMARGSGDYLYYCSKTCIAILNSHGLRHAGGMHSSILPDSAMRMDGDDVGDFQSPRHIGLGIYKTASACSGPASSSADAGAHTPRTYKWIFKIGRLNCNCCIHGDGLYVGKALGHLKAYAARCPLGGGPSGAIRLTGPAGHRALRPEQQPRDPHPPLGTSEIGSGEVPPGSAPMTAHGLAHRQRGVVFLASWMEEIVQHWLESWKGAWATLVHQGALAAASSTVISLMVVNRVPVLARPHERGKWFGWSCLLPYVSKSCLQILDSSASQIQLLLLPACLLASLEFGEIGTSALSCLTNSCLASVVSKPICGTLGDLVCLRACAGEVAWSLGGDAMASMGDGILALENDRVALPGCAGGAACTAKSGPGREGNSRQFSNFGVFNRIEDPGFQAPKIARLRALTWQTAISG